jgi:hypothetical protein
MSRRLQKYKALQIKLKVKIALKGQKKMEDKDAKKRVFSRKLSCKIG